MLDIGHLDSWSELESHAHALDGIVRDMKEEWDDGMLGRIDEILGWMYTLSKVMWRIATSYNAAREIDVLDKVRNALCRLYGVCDRDGEGMDVRLDLIGGIIDNFGYVRYKINN